MRADNSADLADPVPVNMDDNLLAALQANLDAAVADRNFVGGWQEPWPRIRVSELGTRAVKVDVPGTKTTLTIELNQGTVRVEAMNPYEGIDLMRLVTATDPGYPARMYCEC